jgi:hypothetical protein
MLTLRLMSVKIKATLKKSGKTKNLHLPKMKS